MSITSSLYTSFYGLRNSEGRISVTSQNVTNADKPGYTRKELSSQYVTTNAGTVPVGGSIETVDYNNFMLKSLVEDTSVAQKNDILANFLNTFGNEIGSIDGSNTISTYLNDFTSALDQLTITPEDTSLKNQLVAFADRAATEMNRLSDTVQETRLQADKEIAKTVTEINDILTKLDLINVEIQKSKAMGKTTSNLVDDRNVELEKLSSLINISYFTDSAGKLNIYSNGRPLLDSQARTLEYTANTALDKTTLHPSGFNGIDLDGFDMTTAVQGGKLGGLIDVRDKYMVEEQAKLDALAGALITQMNALTNQGATIPSRETMTGSASGLTAADPLGATGNLRIATTDANGVVQNVATVNLGGYATIGDMIAGINGAMGPDITASLTTNGQLRLSSNNAGEGVALNQLTSNFGSGEDFSTRFGLNNMFDGSGADDIQVSSYLVANGAHLPTSRLNAAATAGQSGVSIGDSSLITEMKQAMESSYSFAAAGNFAAQSQSINNYVDDMISDLAYRASNAESTATTTKSLMDQTKTTLENLSGVNIDEEMAHLVDLEAKYEASATMIKTLQEMFDTLLGAVR